MGFFFKNEEEERDTAQRKALKKGTAPDATALDVAKGVKASVFETGALVNAGIRAVAGETSSAGRAAAFREQRDTRKAAAITRTMSPGGRSQAAASFLPTEEGYSAFDNPLGFVTFNGPKQLPILAVSAIPGAAIGRGFKLAMSLKAARAGTTAVTAGTGGALNAGDVMHSIFTELDNMTIKDWSKHKPYLDLISKGMNSKQAIDQLTDDIVAKALPAAAGLGVMVNTFGLNQILARAGAGTLAKKGLLRGGAEGFAAESGQEFLEEGSGALIAQAATKFGDDFNWVAALDQALSGAAVGGPLGGIGGGVANIGKPKKIPVTPPKAPDPAQAAAAQGAPLPPVIPPKTPSTVSSVPVGPPVVSPGAHTPPPGKPPAQKDSRKASVKAGAGAAVVESSVIPDAAQVAALNTTVPPPPVQAPPEVTPEPIIRRRAQAAAQPPIVSPEAALPPQGAAPVLSEQEVSPPLPPPPVVPPAPQEVLTPRVLPDLAAQQEFQRKVEAPSQGTRYELGANVAEVENFPKHQAWRRLMEKQATKPDASPIATEAAGIVGKRGTKLTFTQKKRLQELHAAWIDMTQSKPALELVPEETPTAGDKGQRGKLGIYDQEVESAEDFLKVIARENVGSDKEAPSKTAERIESIIGVLADAPERQDIAEAIVNSPYAKAVISLASKIRDGSVTDRDVEYFRAVEKDFTAQTQEELDAETRDIEAGGRGSGGMGVSDIPEGMAQEKDNDQVAVVTKTKKGVVQEESTGPASEVRKVEPTAEEKAAILAKYGAKAPAPKAVEAKAPEVTQRVTSPKVEAIKEVAKKKAKPKKVITVVETRADKLRQAGLTLLDWRRQARTAARESGPGLEGLLVDIKNFQEGIKAAFGQAAYDRTLKEVEAMLAHESTPAMRSLSMSNVVSGLIRRRQSAGVYEDKDGNKHQAVRTTTANQLFSELKDGGNFNALATDAMSKAAIDMMLPRLSALAGDVKVHILDRNAAVFLRPGFRAAGFYDSIQNVIILDAHLFSFDSRHDRPGFTAHVAMHEVAHAAFWHSIRNPHDQRTPRLLEYLRAGIIDMIGKGQLVEMGMDYGFINVDELVSEAWSNPKFQRFLADIEVPQELAIKIGLSRFKKYSVWSAFVEIVRKAMGFEPSINNALEFVLAATHQMASTRLDADTETYWRNATDGDWAPPAIDIAPMRAAQDNVIGEMRRRVPGGKFRGAMLKMLTLHQITQLADRYFPQGMALKVSDIIGSIAVRRQELVAEAQRLVVTATHKLSQLHDGTAYNSFVDLAEAATTNGVDISVPLNHPNNKHVKKGYKWSNARAVHKELSPQWNALTPDLKDLWKTSAKFYKDRQDTLTLNQLNNIVQSVLGRREEQLVRRIFDGVMTDADRKLFLTNAAMRAISLAQELKKVQGIYFPKMRRGDYVVTGYYKMPKIYSKNRIKKSDSRYLFDTRQEAEAFQKDMRDRGLVITNTKTYSVDAATSKKTYTYADPATGVLHKDAIGAPKQYRFSKGDTGTKEVFEVTAQNKLVAFYDTQALAIAGEAEWRSNSHYKIAGYQLKEDLAPASPRASTSQMRRVFKTMEGSARFKDMGGVQRVLLKQAMQELSLGFLSSTAPQNRALPRRNVLGASKEFDRNIAEYASTSSGAIANSEKQPLLGEAMEALEKHSDENKYQSGSTTGPRSQILQEIRNSVNNQETNKPTTFNNSVNYLLTLSFLDKLVSPAYHIINSMQPGMVAAPIMGGRHGFSRSYIELVKSYNVIGAFDVMKSGVKDTKKALTDMMEGTTDYIADMHARLAKQKDGAELISMMDYIYSTGRINKDAGFEVAEMINNPGKFGRSLQRVDHVVRQFGIAVEVVNRATTAVAAYRLERAKGASIEEAQRYAQEVVTNTQGDYTYSNAPRAFKHPLARIVLQFKKFAQLQYFLLARTTYNAFKGATRAEKAEAAKQLTGLLIAHAAMAGALGLPTEPIKITLMLLALIGIPVPKWDEIEGQIGEMAKEYMGENLGDSLAHGLPRLVGVDIHSRVGLNSLLIFGEPRKDDAANVKSWMWDTAMGAPFGLGQEKVEGLQAVFDGRWGDVAEKLAPFKIASDAVKAAREATEGKVNKRGEEVRGPSSILSTITRVAGFKPAGIARQEEATSAFFVEAGKRKIMRQDLIDRWKAASGKERGAVQKEITAYNKTVPKDAKITGAVLARSLKRSASDKKKGYVKKGVYGGKANKDLLDQYLGD